VGVEIVARRHGLVHPRQVDSRPERRLSLPASGRCGESNGEDDHREQTCRGNFPILHVLRVSQFQFANTITYCRASIPYSLAVAAPGEAAFGAAPTVSRPLCALETSVFALTSWAEIQHTPNRREVRHEDPARYLGISVARLHSRCRFPYSRETGSLRDRCRSPLASPRRDQTQ